MIGDRLWYLETPRVCGEGPCGVVMAGQVGDHPRTPRMRLRCDRSTAWCWYLYGCHWPLACRVSRGPAADKRPGRLQGSLGVGASLSSQQPSRLPPAQSSYHTAIA